MSLLNEFARECTMTRIGFQKFCGRNVFHISIPKKQHIKLSAMGKRKLSDIGENPLHDLNMKV